MKDPLKWQPILSSAKMALLMVFALAQHDVESLKGRELLSRSY